MAASESKTWAGYTVPVLNVLSVDELFGDGTASDPYLIYTENDLANLSATLVRHPHAHFRLMNDLYMANQPAVKSIGEFFDGTPAVFSGCGGQFRFGIIQHKVRERRFRQGRSSLQIEENALSALFDVAKFLISSAYKI